MSDAELSFRSMKAAPAFLKGGGDCAGLIAARDWSTTSLGPIESWPQSLKTATSILLRSPVPIVMLWGDEGIMLYNDAYSAFAGGRHPRLLGSKVREGWPEVADFNDHVMKVGLAGDTLAYKDQELTLYRHGVPEQVWMDLDYSPVLDESGRPAGVLCILAETTERVQADRRLMAERDQQRRALQQMPGFVALLSGPEHVFDYVNDAYIALAGERDYVGRSVREVLPEVAGQGFYELLDAVFTSARSHVARGTPVILRGDERFVDFIYHPLHDEEGSATGIFVGGYDVTEHVRHERALRESEERFRVAQAAGGIGTFELFPDTGRIVVSEQFCRLWGVPPVREAEVSYFLDLVHPEDRERIVTGRSELPERALDYVEYRIIRPDTGETRWMARKGEAVPDDVTGRLRYFGISIDITARKRDELHQRLLINELNHRVKNTLAIVQGIAQQSFKDPSISAASRQAFEGRLAALSAAHNVLTRENWEAAAIHRIIEDAVAPYRGRAEPFAIDGPHLALSPKTAVSLALAVHELATNAVKYGALSVPDGKVDIGWQVGDGRLRLVWREQGGPPVAPPARRGFGSRMIERGLAAELGGEVMIEFKPEGVVCTVDAPLPEPA